MVNNKSKEKLVSILLVPILIILVVLLSPIIVVWYLRYLAKGLILKHSFRKKLKKENKNILFAYSDSHHWQQYIEENILPVIESSAIVINRSRDSEWKNNNPIEYQVIDRWGGGKEYNPIAIIFPQKGKIKNIRFYQAFKDLKHGNSAPLKEKENELFDYL